MKSPVMTTRETEHNMFQPPHPLIRWELGETAAAWTTWPTHAGPDANAVSGRIRRELPESKVPKFNVSRRIKSRRWAKTTP
jgi:hypothetical protein